MSPDVHALTGAYVLDAVSELERASFERHLAECGACTQEVRELRETATRLGRAVGTEAPPYLKDRVLGAIRVVRQLPPEVTPAPAPARHRAGPRWAFRLTSAAAAVLVVVAAVLGVLLVRSSDDLDESRQYANSLTTIIQSGDARVAAGSANTGGTATVLYSRTQDRALVLADGMPEAPTGKDYQAWVITSDDQMRSVGLLPRSGSSRLNLSDIARAKGFGVTLEPAGGSKTPTDQPIMLVNFLV